MSTFRIHVTTENDYSAVTNLITGIGQLQDESGSAVALSALAALESEIAFVKRYIVTSGRTAFAKGHVRSDSKRSGKLEDAIANFQLSAPGTSGDIRHNATGEAIR